MSKIKLDYCPNGDNCKNWREDECSFPWYLECSSHQEKQSAEERGRMLDQAEKIEAYKNVQKFNRNPVITQAFDLKNMVFNQMPYGGEA